MLGKEDHMNDCKGCESRAEEHTLECLADSYLTFTGAHELPEDVRDKIKAAFVAGFEWREQPTATDKAMCPKCGNDNNVAVYPITAECVCEKCDHAWRLETVIVISPPREVKP